MTTANPASATSASVGGRLLAIVLGAFIVGFIGFSHVEAAHNAGHDYRHSMAFPCH